MGERLLLVVHQLRLLLQNFLRQKLASKRRKTRRNTSFGDEKREGREGEEETLVPDELRDAMEERSLVNPAATATPPPPYVPPTVLRIHRESLDPSITCTEDQLAGSRSLSSGPFIRECMTYWKVLIAGKLAEFLDTAISFKLNRIKPSDFHAMFFTVNSKTESEREAVTQAKDAMQELEGILIPLVCNKLKT